MVSAMPRYLSQLLAGVEAIESRLPGSGPADPAIEGLAYDSRQVRPGWLFFALSGLHADGHRFVGPAIAAGAKAIVHSQSLPSYDPEVAYIRVPDSRVAMSPIAADFYGRPSRSLAVIGVTGTEGKSTTVYLIYQLLKLAGFRAGFFSTVMSDTGGGEEPNPEHQTTPEATAVQRMLAQMRDAGMEYAVVESSSHGLSPVLNRLGDVEFDVGIMMNVAREHLEFHGSWERYRDDKANLFRAIGRRIGAAGDGTSGAGAAATPEPKSLGGRPVPRFGVVNADDPSADYFRAAANCVVRGFSAAGAVKPGKVELAARGVSADSSGVSFKLLEGGKEQPARIELPGAFNVANTLAAVLAVSGLTGLTTSELVPLLPRLKPVRGRMTAIDRGQAFEVIVDYAHTPSSFLAVFPPLRERIKGRMICVFGSGGERDLEKRPRQGRIAADYFDILILADEDPRGEDPVELLEQIAAGCPELPRGERLFLIPDRFEAIRKAFSLAKAGDLVALLGKGHENSIIYASGSIPYDEIAAAEKALAELGYMGSAAELGYSGSAAGSGQGGERKP
jgi:UDP-N-acetylmuramoyl-L-alanyl-D-glutamate--2,6-diaminopimelate ligase